MSRAGSRHCWMLPRRPTGIPACGSHRDSGFQQPMLIPGWTMFLLEAYTRAFGNSASSSAWCGSRVTGQGQLGSHKVGKQIHSSTQHLWSVGFQAWPSRSRTKGLRAAALKPIHSLKAGEPGPAVFSPRLQSSLWPCVARSEQWPKWPRSGAYSPAKLLNTSWGLVQTRSSAATYTENSL